MGADYILTQMFFDNKYYLQFVEKCRKIGIHVPIIPGLKPITSKQQLTTIPRTFYISLPDELVSALEQAKDNEAVGQIGVEWCISQTKELLKVGVPCIHYYTMSQPEGIKKVIKSCF